MCLVSGRPSVRYHFTDSRFQYRANSNQIWKNASRHEGFLGFSSPSGLVRDSSTISVHMSSSLSFSCLRSFVLKVTVSTCCGHLLSDVPDFNFNAEEKSQAPSTLCDFYWPTWPNSLSDGPTFCSKMLCVVERLRPHGQTFANTVQQSHAFAVVALNRRPGLTHVTHICSLIGYRRRKFSKIDGV